MRKLVIHISCVVVLGAAMISGAQPTPPATSGPPPIPSPLWTQHVAKGVTVTNLTPIAYFRGLLGMSPAERQRVLAERSPKDRELVLQKIHEYQQLPTEVREERLRHTEEHWYLLKLLRLNPVQRQERLKEISPLYTPMILQQLALWDRLPGETRKALLENEHFLRTYTQFQETASQPNDAADKIPPAQRARWKVELDRWQTLPEIRRKELSDAYRQFFYSTGEQQQATIKTLSQDEQRQIDQTLRNYANLPPPVQRNCVESFSKFATMSAEERSQFLHNAAKWETMSEHEREVWRSLVNRLPPMPPDFYKSQLPPMPPGVPGFPGAAASSFSNDESATKIASLPPTP